MGLNVTIDDLISAFRDENLITSILVANFFLVPALAFAIIFLLPLSKEMAAGLILVRVAAGAPSTPKVAELTGGNISYAVAMTKQTGENPVIRISIWEPNPPCTSHYSGQKCSISGIDTTAITISRGRPSRQ